MNDNQQVVYLHLDDIIPNRFQPREVFDERALKELAVSIKEHGVIQPIIVREINDGKYEIIAGERRYKASALAGMTTIPAIVKNLDDKEAAKVALLENLQRRNLNAMEEARTYHKIIELDDMTQEELAKTMGKSQSAVANKLRLLALPDEVQRALLKDEISERHARALLNLTNTDNQINMLDKIIKEKMTVRKLEEEIKKINMPREEKIETNESLSALINPSPVSVNESAEAPKNDTSFLMNPLPNQTINETNNNDDIVNYGEINDEDNADEEEISENEETTTPNFMTEPVDLEKLKSSSSDIGDITKEKTEEDNNVSPLDSLLNIAPPASEKKSISPAEQALRESENENYENSEDYFSSPDLMSVKMPSTSSNSGLGSLYNKEDTKPPHGFDSLIDFNAPKAEKKEEPIKNNSLGEALMNEAKASENSGSYNVKDMVDAIRETITRLEARGAKIDTDEMNFEDEYQILIKITK